METYFLIFISISLPLILKCIFNLIFSTSRRLPPKPFSIPIISSFLWYINPPMQIEPLIRSVHARLGPLITLRIGPITSIFIGDRFLLHKAMVEKSAIFADRPKPLPTYKFITNNQHNINSASYGPIWRVLRRNLMSEILHPSRTKVYAYARERVLRAFINRLTLDLGRSVEVFKDIHFMTFSLLSLMCFGETLSEDDIKKIEVVQRVELLSNEKFDILNLWPSVSKILLHKRWKELYKMREDQENVFTPHFLARKEIKSAKTENYIQCYVDTILDLELPDEKRKVNQKEMVGLCSEFLNGGTDTTSSAMQWILANLVKYPKVQETLFNEIKGIVGNKTTTISIIKEEDLTKMPYLKSVILETLRKHPPAHFVLPHTVSEDTMLGQYLVPKGAHVNYLIADLGRDPKVWDDPMSFKPERFMEEGGQMDITGSREIKFVPFGAGRRICPAYALAIHHLEYFVANLVWNLEWKAVEGDDVDMSEMQEFTIVMKNPLKVVVSQRKN